MESNSTPMENTAELDEEVEIPRYKGYLPVIGAIPLHFKEGSGTFDRLTLISAPPPETVEIAHEEVTHEEEESMIDPELLSTLNAMSDLIDESDPVEPDVEEVQPVEVVVEEPEETTPQKAIDLMQNMDSGFISPEDILLYFEQESGKGKSSNSGKVGVPFTVPGNNSNAPVFESSSEYRRR